MKKTDGQPINLGTGRPPPLLLSTYEKQGEIPGCSILSGDTEIGVSVAGHSDCDCVSSFLCDETYIQPWPQQALGSANALKK